MKPSEKAFHQNLTFSTQPDLFDGINSRLSRISIIEPTGYDESTFLRVLVSNKIDIVVDLRSRPIFEKPNYSHKRVMSYLFERNIRYIDVAHLPILSESGKHVAHRALAAELGDQKSPLSFFALCLADARAREEGLVSTFRAELRRQVFGLIEVHPRAIGL